jgi:hypothetical protein
MIHRHSEHSGELLAIEFSFIDGGLSWSAAKSGKMRVRSDDDDGCLLIVSPVSSSVVLN